MATTQATQGTQATHAPQAMTLTQKILAHHAIGLARPWVQAGDMLRIRVDWTIASELAWNGMDRTYALLGRPKIHDPKRFFLAVDHTVDPTTLVRDARTQKLAKLSRDFAIESGIKHFYDANETILHTKFYRDLVEPGQIVLGADSHTSSHGGIGAFAIGLGGADVTAAMVMGESWIEVPEAIAVEFEGELAFGIGGKDVILETLRRLKRNTVAMERSVEYRGAAARNFSTDMRFTVANMTAEFGGLNGIFEPDAVVAAWLANREGFNTDAHYFRADDGAPYAARYPIDLGKLVPLVAKPYAPDNVAPVFEVAGQALHGAFIGACTTTEEELVLAALVLEAGLAQGLVPKQAAEGKRLVVPGDLTIQKRLLDRGLWAFYERAGFIVDPPGCSMCLGVASRKAERDEHWISSQNRNFHNRMGEGSHAWLASAATVAASAFSMQIADPRPLLAKIDQARFAKLLDRDPRIPAIRTVPGETARPGAEMGSARAQVVNVEPTVVVATPSAAAQGPKTAPAPSSVIRASVQRFGDAVDTDAIIPGEFCHLTKLSDLGEKAFHHVRPDFAARVRAGQSIIVAGEGWGSGSSREHAVWALQGAGVTAVIAKTYAFIHKRNLVNEALPWLIIDDKDFDALAQEGTELEVDVAAATILHVQTGRKFQAARATPIVLALQREGGLVSAIQHHGPSVFSALVEH